MVTVRRLPTVPGCLLLAFLAGCVTEAPPVPAGAATSGEATSATDDRRGWSAVARRDEPAAPTLGGGNRGILDRDELPRGRFGTKSAAPEIRHVSRQGSRATDAGDLVVAYAAVENADLAALGEVLREEQLIETVVAELNESLVLPGNVEVALGECGEVNAFYDPSTRQIALCYELLAHYLELFAAYAETDEELEEAGTKAAAALVFTFYHELGHALVDVLDLPIVGREEDAVDQLATVMLLETWDGEESELALLATAESFGIAGEASEELATWDEHALDDQRYYNVLCWTYGSDPDYFSTLTEDGWGLPVDRANRCGQEYEQMSRSWDRLLGPHLVS